jgi:putative FmdB family regulatory protein
MPTYDMRCRSCGTTFEVARPMARADEPAHCPAGHQDTVRLLPAVAVTGRAGRRPGASSAPVAAAPRPAGGGCCGGGCCGG